MKANERRYGEAPETAGCFVIGGVRKNIRMTLTVEGFKRKLCSRDFGDGKYSERWTNGTDAIRIVRSWLVRTGRGDSFTRAVNIVNDVKANEVWIRRSIAKVKGWR